MGRKSLFWMATLVAVAGIPLFALQPPPQTYSLEFGGLSLARASQAISLSSAFTIEAWVFPTAASDGFIVGSQPPGAGYDDYALLVENHRAELVVGSRASSSDVRIAAPSDLPVRKWTHVAGVFAGGVMKLVVNGAVVATKSGVAAPTGANPVSIGAFSDRSCEGCDGFVGAIRLIRIWNRALSVDELAAGADVVEPANATGLAAQWPLDDGPGLDHARDLSPAGNTAELGGTHGYVDNLPRWVHTVILDDGPFFERMPLVQVSGLSDTIHVNTGRLIDIGGDGSLDVVASRIDYTNWTSTHPFALHNDGHGNLTEVSSGVLPQSTLIGDARDYVVADLTGNGLEDFYFADVGPDRPPFEGAGDTYFAQTSSGTFADLSGELPRTLIYTHSVAAADFDGNGGIDVYTNAICCGTTSTVLMNDGHGNLTSEPSRLPTRITTDIQEYTGAVAVDVDRDGDTDIVLGTWLGEPRDAILLNDGTGHFTFAPDEAMPLRPTSQYGESINLNTADFNNDGWPDIVLVHDEGTPETSRVMVYLNNGDGTFRDASAGVPPPTLMTGLGFPWPADLNGDGKVDLVVEGDVLRLLLNRGNGVFVDVSDLLPMHLAANSVLPGDLDHDGLVDLTLLGGIGFENNHYDPEGAEVIRQLKPLPLSLLEKTPCIADSHTLCIDDQPGDMRYRVTVGYHTTQGGSGPQAHPGNAIPLTSLGVTHGGLFWFFDAKNPEMLIKVLNGSKANSHRWVFYSAGTNVGLTTTVDDTETGSVVTYTNPDQHPAPPVLDVGAFTADGGVGNPYTQKDKSFDYANDFSSSTGPSVSCTTTDTSLCIDGRFLVKVAYHTTQGGRDGQDYAGHAISLSSLGVDRGGLFWFFDQTNPEMLVKVIDACQLSGYYWVFYSAGTSVGLVTTVEDTTTDMVNIYTNPDKSQAPPLLDHKAFPCP